MHHFLQVARYSIHCKVYDFHDLEAKGNISYLGNISHVRSTQVGNISLHVSIVINFAMYATYIVILGSLYVVHVNKPVQQHR